MPFTVAVDPITANISGPQLVVPPTESAGITAVADSSDAVVFVNVMEIIPAAEGPGSGHDSTRDAIPENFPTKTSAGSFPSFVVGEEPQAITPMQIEMTNRFTNRSSCAQGYPECHNRSGISTHGYRYQGAPVKATDSARQCFATLGRLRRR
jgi:hypothetical protein